KPRRRPSACAAVVIYPQQERRGPPTGFELAVPVDLEPICAARQIARSLELGHVTAKAECEPRGRASQRRVPSDLRGRRRDWGAVAIDEPEGQAPVLDGREAFDDHDGTVRTGDDPRGPHPDGPFGRQVERLPQ